MTSEEAKSLLLKHSFAGEDVDDPKQVNGFLGSLRPFTGLSDDNYHEVMESLMALSPHLQRESHIDKEIVSAVWHICYLGRIWGLEPEGMLRRNRLIAAEDIDKLATWINTISWAFAMLIGGGDDEEKVFEEAFHDYEPRE